MGNYFRENYCETAKGADGMMALFQGILLAACLQETYLPEKMSGILGFVGGSAAAWFLLKLLRLGKQRLMREGSLFGLEWLIWTIELFVVWYQPGEQVVASAAALSFFGSMALCFLFFGKAVWAFGVNRNHKRSVGIAVLLLGVAVSWSGWFLFGPGCGKETAAMQDIDLQLEEGVHEVSVFSYGKQEDTIAQQTINLTPYVNGYEGWKKTLRDFELGDSLEKTPFRGIVYYPKDGGGYPILCLVHGQHNRKDASYLGYEYLGRYLAAHGYVVVSVDENALNAGCLEALSNENDARAIFLLENMKLLQKWNDTEGNPLQGKMDFAHICLGGHSRGGESISIAALFQTMERYPENGNRTMDYDMKIESLLAIAPTEGQYRPSGMQVTLRDMNYLVIQGMEDQDIDKYPGLTTYQNISFSGKEQRQKTAVFLPGANHGQFNSIWGRQDMPYPLCFGYNTSHLMSQQKQQEILMYLTKQYLDATLKQGKQDWQKTAQKCMPDVPMLYQNQTFRSICSFETDVDLQTDGEAKLSCTGADRWRQVIFHAADTERGSVTQNHVLSIYWKGKEKTPVLHVSGNWDFSGQQMQFDLGTGMDTQPKLEIVFTDADGKQAHFDVQEASKIQKPTRVYEQKIQSLFQKGGKHTTMQTIELSLKNSKEGEVDWGHIMDISFRFGGTKAGWVYLDNIGCREQQ